MHGSRFVSYSVMLSLGAFGSLGSGAHTIDLGEAREIHAHSVYQPESRGTFTDTGHYRVPQNDPASYSFAELAPGIDQRPPGGAGRPGLYRKVLTVAAEPQAETWLMVLCGLGLVAFQLRRTQRLLRHRALAV